jgi:hypothetical protein
MPPAPEPMEDSPDTGIYKAQLTPTPVPFEPLPLKPFAPPSQVTFQHEPAPEPVEEAPMPRPIEEAAPPRPVGPPPPPAEERATAEPSGEPPDADRDEY